MSVRRRAAHYLAGSAAAALISLAALPLVTKRLGPSAFGAIALVVAFISLGNALGTLGTSFVISRFLPSANDADKREIVSGLCYVAAAVSVAWSAVIVVALSLLADRIEAFRSVPNAGIFLGVAAMLLSPYWAIASDVLVILDRARAFALAVAAQAIAGALAVLISLYAFDLGTVSLFVGQLASAAVSFAAASYVLYPYVPARVGSQWRAEILAVARHSLPAQLSESSVVVIERVLLSGLQGLHELGLLVHSQRYRDVGQLGAKAIARSAWSKGLAEARGGELEFETTGRIWSGVHVLLALGGIAMASVGDRFVSLLTNGRFTPAYAYAATWFIYLLIANSARPQLATLFALGDGRTVARTALTANVAGLVALVVLIPLFGVWGAVAGAVVQALVGRVAWLVAARRYSSSPWQDRWVVVGSLLIALTLGAKELIGSGLLESSALFASATSIALIVGWGDVRPIIKGVLSARS